MNSDYDAEASFRANQQTPPGVPSSETAVKRGPRIIGVDTELIEKLGRNDPCPCGSGRRFPALLPHLRTLRRRAGPLLHPRLMALGSAAPPGQSPSHALTCRSLLNAQSREGPNFAADALGMMRQPARSAQLQPR